MEPVASRFTKKKITKGLAKVYQLDLKVNQISPTFVPSNLDIAMSSITKNFRENNTFHSSHFLEIYIKLVTKWKQKITFETNYSGLKKERTYRCEASINFIDHLNYSNDLSSDTDWHTQNRISSVSSLLINCGVKSRIVIGIMYVQRFARFSNITSWKSISMQFFLYLYI